MVRYGKTNPLISCSIDDSGARRSARQKVFESVSTNARCRDIRLFLPEKRATWMQMDASLRHQ
jgi:hypothetical protein